MIEVGIRGVYLTCNRIFRFPPQEYLKIWNQRPRAWALEAEECPRHPSGAAGLRSAVVSPILKAWLSTYPLNPVRFPHLLRSSGCLIHPEPILGKPLLSHSMSFRKGWPSWPHDQAWPIRVQHFSAHHDWFSHGRAQSSQSEASPALLEKLLSQGLEVIRGWDETLLLVELLPRCLKATHANGETRNNKH